MIDLTGWPHRWYGRWKEEVDAHADDASIHDVVDSEWNAQELKRVVAYLESGVMAIASPGIVESLLDPAKIIGTPSWKTDGVWLWTDTLAYYLSVHTVRLPPAFVSHIRDNGYRVPPVGDDALKGLDWPMPKP